MTIDPRAYNITVRHDIFDGVELFEARVKELPDLVEYGETFSEAYELAIDTIATAAAAYREQGRAFPTAQMPADDYSGRVTLRIPRSLHRALAEASDADGVSLNQHMVNVLSYYSGFAAASSMQPEGSWTTIPQTPKPNVRPTHLKLVRQDNLAKAA